MDFLYKKMFLLCGPTLYLTRFCDVFPALYYSYTLEPPWITHGSAKLQHEQAKELPLNRF